MLTCPVTEGTTKSSTSIISTIEFREMYEEGQCLPFVHTRYEVTVLHDGEALSLAYLPSECILQGKSVASSCGAVVHRYGEF